MTPKENTVYSYTFQDTDFICKTGEHLEMSERYYLSAFDLVVTNNGPIPPSSNFNMYVLLNNEDVQNVKELLKEDFPEWYL